MIHKTTRSILSVLLAALLLVTSVPLTPAFADGGAVSLQSESAEGRALEQDDAGTYLIYTAENLKEFAVIVNGTDSISADSDAHAKLMNNIDLSEICGESAGNWTPIGTSNNQYRGTFDGQNFKISGLYINSSTADDQGLFGCLDQGGTVKNLTVSGSVKGDNYVGGVVGYNRGTVENCCNIGTVTGTYDYVGGVVGYNSSSGTVKNCYNTGTVSGNRYVGGVVGQNSSIGNVENCYNTGSVKGNWYVGGVVGDNSGTVKNCYNTGEVGGVSGGESVGGVVGLNRGSSSTVENCYNTGAVSGSGNKYVGGVVGDNIGNVKNCYNTGNINGSGWYVGGVVGWNDSSVKNCYNTGKVTGNGNQVGGVVGYNSGSSGGIGNVTDCYFLKDTAESGIGSDSSAAGAAVVDNLDALCDKFTSDPWTISENLNRPVLKDNHEDDGSEQHPYEIFTATQLKNFRDLVNGKDGQAANPNAHAKLMNNINLSSVCGPTLDSEQPVSWIPIGSISNKYTGTFDGDGHTISGLYIDSDADDQGLFGYVYGGTVKDLTVSGNVSGGWHVGGVVGYNNGGTVTGCIFSGSGSVSGHWYVGGVVGWNSGNVTNCYNTDSITVTGSGGRVGGVVGRNFGGTVENCYNTGAVNSIGNYVGGVVGDNGGPVKNCYNTGTVTGSSDYSYIGGVVGDNSGTVENCYNTGSVTVTGSNGRVGGVVGYNSGPVKNCYNTGTVSDGTTSGGVVGQNSGSVTNCYFLKTADVNKDLPGIGDGSGDAAAKDDTAFHSGEVAWRLQNGQTAGEEDPIPQVWGQSNLTATTSLPTLVALNPDAAKEVYQLTFDWHYEGAPEGTTTTTNVYTNGSVAIPEINHDRAGYHISSWKDASGAPVTTETAVTADTTYTAEWTANTYTITVTAGSGGAVSGSGEYSEGTQVTVTATPATGYHFVNWTENGTEVSTEATFTFNATVDRNLIAIFAKNEEPTPTPTPTPDPTPSGPSTGDSTGWDDIRDELENAENGDEITIDMGDETKVPAEIFESLAGKDVEISFDLGDIQWSVNGADIPTDTDFTDLDLGASLGTSGIPVNVINTITGEVGTVQITLAHNGEFGFTMTLTAPLGKENAGYWANLYHYDEDAEALNFEAAAKIDEDGSVTIPFSHASQYAIVIDTHSHAAVDVSDIFLDVAPDAWYKDAVQYAYDNGLMTGVSANEFAPEQTTTRAMIVSILARLENVTTAEAAGFADVDDEWYATAVNWAANVGVVNGYEDNTFRPNTAITREQLAAILMNYAAYKGEDVSNRADLTSYTDQPSTWAQEAMQWAVAEGLISGVTADTLQPQGAATRAQVAAILQRFLSE